MDISKLKQGDKVEVESRRGRTEATVITTKGSSVIVRLIGERDNVRRYDDEIIRKLS